MHVLIKFIIVIKEKKNCMRTWKNEICQFFVVQTNSNRTFDDTRVIFYSRFPELKKRSKIRAFLAKLWCFFPGAPIWSLLFSFELWATVRATVAHSVSHEQGRAKLPDHLFSDTVCTMKTLFYSNHCKLCIKYKSLTAIPDFKNDDILFIYGAMACYKKKGNLAPNARRLTVFF